MVSQILEWNQTLFKDLQVFDMDYIPDQFKYRDVQLKELAFQLAPGLQGAWPHNVVLRGLHGTGKTTAVRKLFSQVEHSTQRLVPVMVNCGTNPTKHTVIGRIYEKLTGHLAPRTGVPTANLLDSIARMLADRDAAVVLCLDDANYLVGEGVLNDVLLTVLRMHETHPGVRIGVIIVLSAMEVKLAKVLKPGVLSVLHPATIYFPPYDEDETRSILRDRVRQGLYPGVMPPLVFEQIVQRTIVSGDLRTGIDLLKQAVYGAERDARMAVCEEDVTRAYTVSRDARFKANVRALTPEERRVLLAVARCQARDDDGITVGFLHGQLCKEKKISYTALHEHLKKLDALQLLELSTVYEGGKMYVIELREDPEKVMQVCGNKTAAISSPSCSY